MSFLTKMWVRRGALFLGLSALMATHASPPLTAQQRTSGRPISFSPQVSASYFPFYISEDEQTQRRGIDVGARVGLRSGPELKLGYTYVPQATTTSSSAPRLRALRVLLSGSVRLESSSAVTLTGGVGAARVNVKTQHIHCGDFPVCAEWAPRSGTWILPAMEVGAGVEVWGRIGWLFEMTLLIPHGDAWSAGGDPEALGQLSTGISLRLGSRE